MMTRRSRAREVALQLLFWRDGNPTASPSDIARFVRERLRDSTVEPYAQRLVDGVIARQAEIDAQLVATAENWRLSRMAVVDRNVLRLGAFELLEGSEDSPPAVVINEAIELARRYGSADSSAFVNGVLDKIHQLRIADSGSRTENTPEPETPAANSPDLNPESEAQNPQ